MEYLRRTVELGLLPGKIRTAVYAAFVLEDISLFPEITAIFDAFVFVEIGSFPRMPWSVVETLSREKQDYLASRLIVDIDDVIIFSRYDDLARKYLMVNGNVSLENMWRRVGMRLSKCFNGDDITEDMFDRLVMIDEIANRLFPQTSVYHDYVSLHVYPFMRHKFGVAISQDLAIEFLKKIANQNVIFFIPLDIKMFILENTIRPRNERGYSAAIKYRYYLYNFEDIQRRIRRQTWTETDVRYLTHFREVLTYGDRFDYIRQYPIALYGGVNDIRSVLQRTVSMLNKMNVFLVNI